MTIRFESKPDDSGGFRGLVSAPLPSYPIVTAPSPIGCRIISIDGLRRRAKFGPSLARGSITNWWQLEATTTNSRLKTAPILWARVGSSYHRSSTNNAFESRWRYQFWTQ